MNWGNKIFLVMVLFVIGIISLVTISMSQDFYLVEQNYYEEEIAYQKKIDELKNAQKWPYAIEVSQTADYLAVVFENAEIAEGNIQLFCPSDANLDRLLLLEDEVKIKKNELKPGKWKLFIKWQHQDKKYQKSIDIMI